MIEYMQNNAVISGDMKIFLEIHCFDFNKRELCRHYFNSYTIVLYYFPLKKYLLVMQPVGFRPQIIFNPESLRWVVVQMVALQKADFAR